MQNKKTPTPSEPSDPELEERVDKMMHLQSGLKRSAVPGAQPDKNQNLPELDIFEGHPEKRVATEAEPEPAAAPSAPELPDEAGASTVAPAADSEVIEVKKVPGKKPEAEPEPAPELELSVEPKADEPPAGPASEPVESEEALPAESFDDPATDAAVADIQAKEADTLLETSQAHAEAPKPRSPDKPPKAPKRRRHVPKGVWVLLLFIAVLAAVFAWPASRYRLLGLALHKQTTVIVVDSKTHTAVSGAEVAIGGKHVKTDANGKALLTLPVALDDLTIQKQYYRTYTQKVIVGLRGQASFHVSLVATGRQVPLRVINRLTGKPLEGAVIQVRSTNAKTDKNGMATIVLPADAAADPARINLSGYNSASVTVAVTGQAVPANTFALVPAGQAYFLTNQSGHIDVAKANLDGSDRKTVLAGSGKEDPNATLLVASSDWRYLSLLSKHDGGQYAKLFLINTSTDQFTTIDQGSFTFTAIGWMGHYFVYLASNPAAQPWESGGSMIKSYDADTGKTLTLASTKASGSSTADAEYENIWEVVPLHGALLYTRTWYKYPGYLTVSGQQNTLAVIHPDGSGAKTLKTVDAASYYFSNLKKVQPGEVDLGVYGISDGSTNYYRVDSNFNLTQSNTITRDTLNQQYPDYLTSPSGSQRFWSEIRDGKHTLFVGDASGANARQIATLSDYAPFGWYGDNYVLVSKNGSELYVMPASGLSNGQQALKITDYYSSGLDSAVYGAGSL